MHGSNVNQRRKEFTVSLFAELFGVFFTLGCEWKINFKVLVCKKLMCLLGCVCVLKALSSHLITDEQKYTNGDPILLILYLAFKITITKLIVSIRVHLINSHESFSMLYNIIYHQSKRNGQDPTC